MGIEKLLDVQSNILKGQRVGLICNQASVDHSFEHVADLMFRHPDIDLRVLFGPQHGIRGDVQDNMIETAHTKDADTGLPIYSLYSETREPDEEMLQNIDTLVFDLQDVGCRVYTFIYTMANAMKGCARHGKRFVVCDRPNPINGIDIEGSLMVPGNESFVGMYPIPMRHGLTVGELAEMFNREFDIGCDLTVVKMDGWKRELFYDETDAPWVMPSPNMPTVDTAVVFPGTVYLEGTQVSEGRGTTRPFEIVGAPYVNARSFAQDLMKLGLPGVTFRATNFLPTFQKHSGTVCGGVFLHVTDRKAFEPVITGLALIRQLLVDYRDEFRWKIPPYEYEYERNPFDVISGDQKTREMLENALAVEDIRASWQNDLKEFEARRKQFLLY